MSDRSETLSGEIFESAMMAVQSGGNNLRLLAKYMIFMVNGTPDVPGPLWPARVLHGKRQTFSSFHHYLLDQPGDGIGLPSLHFLKQVLEATPKDGERAIAAVRAELAREHVDFDAEAKRGELKLHGERPPAPTHEEHPGGRGKTSDNVTGLGRGNSAAYLASVLNRDHPAIADRLAHGEFRSVRAAAKAAGIVSDPDALDQLRRWWKKASDEQRTAFLDEEGLSCKKTVT